MDRRNTARWFLCLALALGAGSSITPVFSQPAWPSRALSVVVPYPPGGNTDVITRVVMEKLSSRIGQPVVVENKPGAGGIIGSSFVAKAAPDGYTFLIAIPGFALNQSLYKELPYRPDDLQPVALLTRTSLVLVTNSTIPARNFTELLDYGRKAAPPLTFASSGPGSMAYILSERFLRATGIEQSTHVPYKGSADALTDLVGGRIGFMFDAVSAMGPHIQQGRVLAMAVTGTDRSPMLPEVPTISELGHPELVTYAWAGLLAPAGVPVDITRRLASELHAVLHELDVVTRLAAINTEPVGSSPEEFSSFLDKEVAIGKETITRTGLTLQ